MSVAKRPPRKDETKKTKKANEEKSPIDCLMDEENVEDIVLYDANGKRTVFEQVAVIPVASKIYAILKPVEKLPDIADDQALVFMIDEVNDEECLSLVDDDKLIDEVFDKYYDLLKKEGLM